MIPFEFNAYSALLLPAFIHGLLFASLAIRRYIKECGLHDLFLGLLLILLSIRLSFWMLGFAGWYDRYDGYTSLMFYFPFNTLPFIGPCLYFYFNSVTNREFRIQKSHWPHFVLPVALLLLCVIKYLVDYLYYAPFPNTQTYQFATHGPWAQIDKSDIVYLVSYISLIGYLWLILKNFGAYRRYLSENFSETSAVDLDWLKRLLLFTGLSIGLMLLFYIANMINAQLTYKFNWYPYLFLGLAIYYTGINGFFNAPAFSKELHFANKTQQTEVNRLPQLEDWKQKLQTVIDTKRPHLRPELTLAELADLLATNTGVISRVINEGYGLNFNEYINKLRIDEFIVKLEKGEQKRLTLMGMAYDCGFNSKTTFNRSFKTVTGKTPGEFIKTSSKS